MRSLFSVAALAATTFSTVHGVPMPQVVNNADIPGEAVGPVGATGNVYATKNLLGPVGSGDTQEIGPGVPDPTGSSTDVGPYSLVAGQGAEPTLGLYLDFTNSPNPQPLRGVNGATDPGPSKCIGFCWKIVI